MYYQHVEKIKPEDTVFVIIKQTIEEQFGNPKTGEIPKFPEIIIDCKEFEIKIVGDHTTREAFGTILQEEDNYPTHFKINFEKSGEGLVAKLPIKDNSRKIAINLEQPVQRGYTSIAPITGSTVTVTRPQPTLRPELMSFTTCPECDEVTKAQEIDIIVRVFEDRKKKP